MRRNLTFGCRPPDRAGFYLENIVLPVPPSSADLVLYSSDKLHKIFSYTNNIFQHLCDLLRPSTPRAPGRAAQAMPSDPPGCSPCSELCPSLERGDTGIWAPGSARSLEPCSAAGRWLSPSWRGCQLPATPLSLAVPTRPFAQPDKSASDGVAAVWVPQGL